VRAGAPAEMRRIQLREAHNRGNTRSSFPVSVVFVYTIVSYRLNFTVQRYLRPAACEIALLWYIRVSSSASMRTGNGHVRELNVARPAIRATVRCFSNEYQGFNGRNGEFSAENENLPEKNAELHEENAESPERNAEFPEENAESPEENAESPEENAESHERNAELPKSNGKLRKRNQVYTQTRRLTDCREGIKNNKNNE
jgi:transposase-like protein